MKNVFDIFTSRARVGVLRALSFQAQAVPLRHIACMSELPVFSVQNATASLLSDGIIARTEEGNNVLFELSRASVFHDLLVQFFILEAMSRIRAEAEEYSGNAKRTLKFAGEANVLFDNAKRRARR